MDRKEAEQIATKAVDEQAAKSADENTKLKEIFAVIGFDIHGWWLHAVLDDEQIIRITRMTRYGIILTLMELLMGEEPQLKGRGIQ